MRLYLLDKFVCPRCGHFPLDFEVKSWGEATSFATHKRPCERYCGFERNLLNTDEQPPCSKCLSQQVLTGTLSCSQCGDTYPVIDGIPHLLIEHGGEKSKKWVEEERAWWDRRYAKLSHTVRILRQHKAEGVPGNRDSERYHYLFKLLKDRLKSSLIVEIGAGTSRYVASLLPPAEHSYFYIGTDISLQGLYLGRRLMPEGDFVLCAAGAMPFRDGVADVVLSLGVLHHIPDWKTSLPRLLDLLKDGGLFVFDEAIEKPRILGRFRKQSLTAAIDSPHEGEVVLEEMLRIMQEKGEVWFVHTKTTPVRVLLVFLFGRLMEHSVGLTKLVLGIDQWVLKTMGKLWASFGPGEALGIFERGREVAQDSPRP